MRTLQLLLEGFESALLPCSLILLVPGVSAGLAARMAAVPAMAGFGVGALGLSWARFAERGGDYHPAVAAAGFLVATVVLLVPLISRMDLTGLVGGLVSGAAAAELWRPCVGEHYGLVLNELPSRGLSGLFLQAVYLIGVLSPMILVGALHRMTPDSILDRVEPPLAVIGGTLLAVLALTTAVGLHDEVVGRLFQWSGG